MANSDTQITSAFVTPVSYYIGDSKTQKADITEINTFNHTISSYLWGNSYTSKDIVDLVNETNDSIVKKLLPMFRRKNTGIIFEFTVTNTTSKSWAVFKKAIKEYSAKSPQSTRFVVYIAPIDNTSTTDQTDNTSTKITGDSPAISNDAAVKDPANSLATPGNNTTNNNAIPGTQKLYLRVFPQTGYMLAPTKAFLTTLLSNNEILQVSNLVGTNALCALQNNLALNTLDAQWVDLYTLFFDYWVRNEGNRAFTLTFGDYVLRNCFFRTHPQIPQNLDVMSTFNLDIISGIRTLSDITL